MITLQLSLNEAKALAHAATEARADNFDTLHPVITNLWRQIRDEPETASPAYSAVRPYAHARGDHRWSV